MTGTRRVPDPVAGVDVMTLPLSTLEGFVLSRADGRSTVEDISIMVGVDLDKLLAILDRLADLGAVNLPWVEKHPEPTGKAGTAAGGDACIYDNPLTPPAFDPRELEARADIDRKTRRRILNAYHSLRGRNFYQLLGVTELADKSEIRTAYFELSKQFHPDAFFGRDLGSFKPKMEAVFKRLTEAYEVLGRKKRRKEYDDYLGATNRTRVTQTKMEQARVEAQVLRRSEPPVARDDSGAPGSSEGSSERPSEGTDKNPLRAPRVPREAGADAHADSAPPRARPAPSPRDRRAIAAVRLRRRLDSVAPPGRTPRREPPGDDAGAGSEQPRSKDARRDSAIKGLARSISESSRLSGKPDRVAQYVEAAREAEAGGDLLSAANALQLALALAPEDPELQDYYARLSQVVMEDLARNYEKQARYEEKVGKWAAAARSWKRVVEGRPGDPEAARQAANALLRSGGDLHRAQKYAQTAVDLSPDEVGNLVVLARVMLAAGLKLNARRELEKAVKLDPNDDMVKNLLREAT